MFLSRVRFLSVSCGIANNTIEGNVRLTSCVEKSLITLRKMDKLDRKTQDAKMVYCRTGTSHDSKNREPIQNLNSRVIFKFIFLFKLQLIELTI